jgi:hypothetical protein
MEYSQLASLYITLYSCFVDIGKIILFLSTVFCQVAFLLEGSWWLFKLLVSYPVSSIQWAVCEATMLCEWFVHINFKHPRMVEGHYTSGHTLLKQGQVQ